MLQPHPAGTGDLSDAGGWECVWQASLALQGSGGGGGDVLPVRLLETEAQQGQGLVPVLPLQHLSGHQ